MESLGAGVPALVCKHQMDIAAHSYYKTEMKRNEIYWAEFCVHRCKTGKM